MKSEKVQHEFAAKTLLEAVNKCEKNGVSAEVLVQTFVSVAVTLLLAHSDEEEVATLLEGMAGEVRRGEMTRDDRGTVKN